MRESERPHSRIPRWPNCGLLLLHICCKNQRQQFCADIPRNSPWLAGELSRRIDRLWLGRLLSPVQAERLFIENIEPATDEDWAQEYLSADLAVAVVPSLDAAVDHIRRWSSGHTEAICTNDLRAADEFVARVDSAVVVGVIVWFAATNASGGRSRARAVHRPR